MRHILGSLTAVAMLSAVAAQEEAAVTVASPESADSHATANASGATKKARIAGPRFCEHGLKRDFGLEDREDSWADTAEAVLFSHIAQAPGLALTHLAVQCQATICRLRFTFPTKEYQRDFGNTLVADALNSAPGFVRDFGLIELGADDLPKVEYYLKRDGVCVTRPVI